MAKIENKTELLGKRIPLTIEKLANGGDGVGHYEGKVVFVPWSAPGDQLTIEVSEDHPRYAKGDIVELVEPSQERVTPRCTIFGTCGGCQWQHMNYQAQLMHKAAIYRETLEHVGGLKQPQIEDIIPASRPWQYRNRIQLKVDSQGTVGFFAKGSHRVVRFDDCSISRPELNAWLKESVLPKDNFELVWNEVDQQVEPRRDEPPYRVFEQVNQEQNRHLVDTVLEYCEPQSDQRVVELYCGNGNFSLVLAPRVAQFFAIDQNAEAVGRAARAANQAGFKEVEFLVGSAEWGLKKILRQRRRADTLLLDPPRGGAKDILDLMVVLSAHRIVYVSCDAAALARDVKFLTSKGYRMVKARPIDMFPQTYHTESVVQLVHT